MAAPNPGEIAALQTLFDEELAQARALRAREAARPDPKQWLFFGLLGGMLSGFLRGVVTHPDSPVPLQTLAGDVLFSLGFLIMMAAPALFVLGAVGSLFSRRAVAALYVGAGIGIGSGILAVMS